MCEPCRESQWCGKNREVGTIVGFFFSPVTLVISLKFPNSNGGVVYLSIKGFITGM